MTESTGLLRDMEHLLGKVGYDRRPPSEESYDKYNNVIECRAFGK